MDLDLNKEQEMLKTSAREFLTKNCPRDLVREMAEDEKGYPPDLWKKIAELGWLGLGISEEYGGSGGDFLDVSVLLEEMGRVCLPGPFVTSTVVSASLLMEAGNNDQKQEILSKVADGDLILTLAFLEEDVNYDVQSLQVQAVREGENFVINGTKVFVPDAHVADYFICAARTDTASPEGVTLFLVDAKSPGLVQTVCRTFAGNKTSEVVFKDVKVPAAQVIGEINGGSNALKTAMSKGAIATCVQMLGAAQHALEMSVEHSKIRVQFGKPIGSFQSIQFLCADAQTEVDGTRLLAYQAAWKLAEGLPSEKEVAIAKSWVNDSFGRALEITVQVHGGQGIMYDEGMTLYTKRALDWRTAYGGSDFHRETLARELGM